MFISAEDGCKMHHSKINHYEADPVSMKGNHLVNLSPKHSFMFSHVRPNVRDPLCLFISVRRKKKKLSGI